jgi:hypothetical protein
VKKEDRIKKFLVMILILFGAMILVGNNALAQGPHSYMRGEKYFDANDTNEDGKISLDEHQEKSEKCFKKMDADGDGNLIKEEFCQGWRKSQEYVEGMKKKEKKLLGK